MIFKKGENVAKTGLLFTASPEQLKPTWQKLAQLVSLKWEGLDWSAPVGQSRAVSEIGFIAFEYVEWKALSEEVKKELRPLISESFKLIEIRPEDQQDWKKEFLDSDSKTFFLNFDYGIEYWKPGVLSFLKTLELHHSRELLQVGEGLNKLVEQSLQELQRVKKIHETLVPLRTEKIKGLSVVSKFAAGEASGGEFYDVVEGEEEFVVILSHTNSYVVSSLVLSAFDEFRKEQKYDLEKIQKFSVDLANLVKKEAGVKSYDELQLFLARVDMKSLVIEGVNWGHSQLVSSGDFFVGENDFPIDSSFIEKSTFQNKLARSERYALLSPGLRLNCGDRIEGEGLVSYSRRMMQDGPKKALQETFYQLKKNRESSFLKYDATHVYIEVDPNVIVQL